MRSSIAMRTGFLCLAAVVRTLCAQEPRTLVAIDFFGYAPGEDLAPIRRALPFREGMAVVFESFPAAKSKAEKAVKKVTGRRVTDVSLVCCNQGGWTIYVGLGATVVARSRPKPSGGIRLPIELLQFYSELMNAFENRVGLGSQGDGGALDRKLADLRTLAARHEAVLVEATARSSDGHHRAVAAFALGHGLDPSPERIKVLVDAASDPNSTVRNNAARGLTGWASKWPGEIPAGVFIEMARSGTWTDRNKGINVLAGLAETRDPAILAAIRSDARTVAALKEVAAWRWEGHAEGARRILELLRK